MAICKRCGANDLLTSDLCGNAGCIYCCGTSIEELESVVTIDSTSKCKYCDKKAIEEGMCMEHYLKSHSKLYAKEES